MTAVHDNIAAFGGSPSRIIAFGQSAGGMVLVCFRLPGPADPGCCGLQPYLFHFKCLHLGEILPISSPGQSWSQERQGPQEASGTLQASRHIRIRPVRPARRLRNRYSTVPFSDSTKYSALLASTSCTNSAQQLACLRIATVAQILAGQGKAVRPAIYPEKPLLKNHISRSPMVASRTTR